MKYNEFLSDAKFILRFKNRWIYGSGVINSYISFLMDDIAPFSKRDTCA